MGPKEKHIELAYMVESHAEISRKLDDTNVFDRLNEGGGRERSREDERGAWR